MQVTTTRVGGLLPRQIQRALPICVGFILLTLLFSKAESLGSTIKPADVLKRIISLQTPIQITRDEFPKKIWQTWKVDTLNLDERDLGRARTWTTMNSAYRYELLTDDGGLHYVETNFGPQGLNRPDIIYTYRTLALPIIKADLLRYLIMYVEGGIYADIDVEALKPIDVFIPTNFNEKDVDVVIGVEIDEPNFANHTILGRKSRSFCQWTFMCKPRTPVMMRLIDNIIEWLNDVARLQGMPISQIQLDFDQVISGTGPSAFTHAIMAEMSSQTGRTPHWDEFHALQQPKLVGNILVLTVEAFAAGQGHSNSGDHDNPKARVRHHYHASLWPSRHPRYSHPAYGMVEECNWEPECVQTWDNNKANYPNLSPDEQASEIALKVQADKEKFDGETEENKRLDAEEADARAADLQAQCDAAGRGSRTADSRPSPAASVADIANTETQMPESTIIAEQPSKNGPNTEDSKSQSDTPQTHTDIPQDVKLHEEQQSNTAQVPVVEESSQTTQHLEDPQQVAVALDAVSPDAISPVRGGTH